MGCSGPTLRASGVPYDIRRTAPYSGYENFDFDVIVGEHGDVYDRFLLPGSGNASEPADHRAGARRHAGRSVADRRPQDRAAAQRRDRARAWSR